MLRIIPAIIISYFIGSLPTGYILGRLLKGVDIRKLGSGNVGATNAMRVLGKKAGLLVLLIDTLKGALAVMIVGNFISFKTDAFAADIIFIVCGLACIAGHNWSIFLNFKGGKGVATTLGVLSGLALQIPGLSFILLMLLLTWFLVFILFKIVSLASIVSALMLVVYLFIFGQSASLKSLGILLSVLILLRHKANLKRLIRGQEPRLKPLS